MDTKPIITRRGEVKEIARLMGTSPRTVYSALRGHTRSPLAMRIRQCALNHGGFIEVPGIGRGQWLTEFAEADRSMRVRFWNGIEATLGIDTSRLSICRPGRCKQTIEQVTPRRLTDIFRQLAEEEPALVPETV